MGRDQHFALPHISPCGLAPWWANEPLSPINVLFQQPSCLRKKQAVELSLAVNFLRLKIGLNRFEILPRHRVRWIQAQCGLKLLERLLQFA
jgi:hypothetical protein